MLTNVHILAFGFQWFEWVSETGEGLGITVFFIALHASDHLIDMSVTEPVSTIIWYEQYHTIL